MGTPLGALVRRLASSELSSLKRLSNRVWLPVALVVLLMPAVAGVTLNGAYLPERYPWLTPPAELSARNVGKMSDGLRCGNSSAATMLPILGAILPSAASGLRPICTQVWHTESTTACVCT